MRTQAWLIVTFSALAAGLAGCGGDNSPGASVSSGDAAEQAPPTPASTDFNVYAQSLVSTYSCETNPPAESNNIDFSFLSSADIAQPVDTTDDAEACKV